MIESFANQDTEDIFNGDATRAARQVLPPALWPKAQECLDQLNAASKVGDMSISPSRHLEKLKGKRAGQWSVRINEKYRVCFWFEGCAAHDVEIVDYH